MMMNYKSKSILGRYYEKKPRGVYCWSKIWNYEVLAEIIQDKSIGTFLPIICDYFVPNFHSTVEFGTYQYLSKFKFVYKSVF
jgi:hypothetical protein